MNRDSWDPIVELSLLRKRFLDLFERSQLIEEHSIQAVWAPPVDMYRDAESFVVKAELPGVVKDEVEIEFRKGQLVICGVRSPACGDGRAVFHRVERQYGPFERRLTVNELIDVEHIQASYEDGILTIHLPIAAQPLEKRIKVQS